MENNQQRLLAMEKTIAEKDRLIWKSMWVIMGISFLLLLTGLLVSALLLPRGIWQLVAILGTCIIFLLPCIYAVKLEVSVGAYKCKECGTEIVPTYKEAMNSMHRGTTRYLVCPNCKKRTWCKKVIKN